jgi:CoA:oxalate CoA-transferase
VTTVMPLADIHVAEFSHYIAGPQCGQILADHGASVVKVEPPGGDRSRAAAPIINGDSHYFAAHNRSKRSLALDLKHPESREPLDALLRWADVLVTNYGVGVPDALGFGWQRAQAVNPRLVMAYVTGFGYESARSGWAAYDGVLQSTSGFADMAGDPDGAPALNGVFVADHVAGLQAAFGVMIALADRENSGEGQLVDVSMNDGMVAMLAHLSSQAANGHAPRRAGNAVPTAFANTFPASDGWVYLAPLAPAMRSALWEVIGRSEVADDERYATPEQRLEARAELEQIISGWTSVRTRAEIVATLQARGVAAGPVNSVADVVRDTGLRERETIIELPLRSSTATVPGSPLKFSRSRPRPPRPYPRPGEHSLEVLDELGLAAAGIEQLVRRGVVRTGEEHEERGSNHA